MIRAMSVIFFATLSVLNAGHPCEVEVYGVSASWMSGFCAGFAVLTAALWLDDRAKAKKEKAA